MDNLIKIYENTISKEVCNLIINEFETSNSQMEGISGAGVNKLVKSSTDLMIHLNLDNPNWLYIYDYLRENLLGNLVEYIEQNTFMTITGGFASKASAVRTAQSCYMAGNNGQPHMQMQRYIGGEGFYAWHRENYSDEPAMAKREMFYIIYLNDVEAAGETEFLFNPQKVKPEVGTIILAPAFWTHTHRGNALSDPNARKYIITGWIEFTENVNVNYDFLEDYTL